MFEGAINSFPNLMSLFKCALGDIKQTQNYSRFSEAQEVLDHYFGLHLRWMLLQLKIDQWSLPARKLKVSLIFYDVYHRILTFLIRV